MYKVFIDNKPVIFAETAKNCNNDAGFVRMNGKGLTAARLLTELSNRSQSDETTLLIESDDPAKKIRTVFSDYKWIEAAGGLVRRGEEYLFIERLGLWDLPKGKMDEGEKPEETAVREIEEECGISRPEIISFLGTTYHTYVFRDRPVLKKNWWYLLRYDGNETLSPQIEEDITKAVWLKLDEWGQIYANTYPSIVEVLQLAKIGIENS